MPCMLSAGLRLAPRTLWGREASLVIACPDVPPGPKGLPHTRLSPKGDCGVPACVSRQARQPGGRGLCLPAPCRTPALAGGARGHR